MKLYVAWGSRDLEQRIRHATLTEDVTGLNRISQSVSQATEFWRLWALAIGGEVVWVDGTKGLVKVPADRLDELEEIRSKYAIRVGVSVSVGVGMKPSEAEKSYEACELENGKIRLFTPEVDEILEGAKSKPKDSVDKLAEEYLKNEDEAMSLRKSLAAGVIGAVLFADPALAPGHVERALEKRAEKHIEWSNLLHQDLLAIAHLETSFAKNMNHAPSVRGAFFTALGSVGLKPMTAHDEYVRNVPLQRSFPGLMDKEVFLKTIKDDLEFYSACASAHWERLKKHVHGDLAKTAFAWRWGIGALDNADLQAVENDPYVNRFLLLHKAIARQRKNEMILAKAMEQTGPEILTAGSPQGPASPPITMGGGRAGMKGQQKPMTPAKPKGEGSEHSDGEAARAEAAEDPKVETTHAAKDFQDQLTEMSEDSEDKDGQAAQSIENSEGADQIRQQVLQVLKQFRSFAPYLDEIKTENADLYNAFMEVVQTMVGYARELIAQEDGVEPDDIEPIETENGEPKDETKDEANSEGSASEGKPAKSDAKGDANPETNSETKKDELAMGKASLPMPHAAAHHPLNLPVGSYKEGDGHIKVAHGDGTTGWVEARAGQVLSHDGHPISALNPDGR
jgi:hypothetical protein